MTVYLIISTLDGTVTLPLTVNEVWPMSACVIWSANPHEVWHAITPVFRHSTICDISVLAVPHICTLARTMLHKTQAWAAKTSAALFA